MEKEVSNDRRESVIIRIGAALLVLGVLLLAFAFLGPADEVAAQALPPGVTRSGNTSTVGGAGGNSPAAQCAAVSNLAGLSLVYYDKSEGDIGTPGDVYGTATMTGGTPTSLLWTTRDAITAVLVKAGPGFNYYIYNPAATSGTGLVSPKADSVSEVTFCWLGQPEPTVTSTSTPVPQSTATPVPTSTPVPQSTATPVATSTPVPGSTATPVPQSTATPVPTSTPLPGSTATPVPGATSTPVPGFTSVPVVPGSTTLPVLPESTSTPSPAAPEAQTDEVQGQQLAFTGRASSGIAIAGFTLLAAGGGCLFAGRRIRSRNQDL